MYIAITGSKNNKDVYIYRSFRKENGKASSCIYKKLGKYNALLERLSDRTGNDGMEARRAKYTKPDFIVHAGKVSVEFSKAATIPMNERRSFNVGYLFLPETIKTTFGKVYRAIKKQAQV